MSKPIIDVSTWNGVIDWAQAKTAIDGAIIRCGYGSDQPNQDDKQFKRNVEECIRLGIPFGIYLYGYANTDAKIESEAEHTLRLITPYKGKLTFPVYYDAEEASIASGLVPRVKKWAARIKAAGFTPGLYSGEYYTNAYIGTGLDELTKWIAKYSSNAPKVPGTQYDMWQYTDAAQIPGINGKVDASHCYKDFTAAGASQTPAASEKTPDSAAAAIPAVKYSAAVKEWQHAMNIGFDTHELTEDGYFGPKSEAFARGHLLRQGVTGCPTAVRWLQRKVGASPDGVFGPATKAAVMKYQQMHGLAADGVAGFNTYKRILEI